MERNPMNNDRRRAIHERNLGDDPECAICGYANTIVLERVEPAIFLALARQERANPSGGHNINDKACALCGCTNADLLADIEPNTLLALVEKARSGQFIILCKTHCNVISGKGAIEDHHTVGRKNHPQLVVSLCGNHHAAETERLRAAGVSMQRARSAHERLASMLRAVAEFLLSLAQAFLSWADELLAESCPSPAKGEPK